MVHAVIEARRSAPSILYLPHLTLWWETAPSSLRATLWMLLADLPPELPLLLLSSADAPVQEIPEDALALFGNDPTAYAHELVAPESEARAAMFRPVCTEIAGSAEELPAVAVIESPPQVPHLPFSPQAPMLKPAVILLPWPFELGSNQIMLYKFSFIDSQLICSPCQK